MTDGHTDYDLLNAFAAADGTAAAPNETTEPAAETSAETEAQTTAEETSAETEATTEEQTTEAATEAETELQATVAVPEPDPMPAEQPSSGSSGILIALVIFFGILLAGTMTTCFLLVKKIRSQQNAPAPDTSKYDKREKDYQAEIVRLAQENERLKDELNNKD
jgi:hypothetical protein